MSNSMAVRSNGASQVHATGSDASRNPNAILSRYQPSGASARTAQQDGLSPGVGASHRMAKTDLAALKMYKTAFEEVGKKYDLPPALLAAIASRESRAGAMLDSRGRGDNGHGFGLMQVDFRYHKPAGGPHSKEHIDQAAGILKDYFNQVKEKHPDWPREQQLRGALAAYNYGVDNVQTLSGIDKGTTGDDYSNDVWARAQFMAPHFGGTSSTGGTDKPAATAKTPAATPKPVGGNTVKPIELSKFDGGYEQQAPSAADVKAGKASFQIGQQGESVKELQKKLNVEADGFFGPETRAAVHNFQLKHGLTPPAGKEGTIGSTTLGWLDNGGCPPATNAKPGTRPTSGAKDDFTSQDNKWTSAPSLNDVKANKQPLREGQQGAAVSKLQELLGLEADGKFGMDTKKAVADFQREHGLNPGAGNEGVVGATTLAAIEKAASTGGTGKTLGNGVSINTNHPVLKTLAQSYLNNGPTGTCVATTLDNMDRLGVPNTPEATGMDPNNPRGGMAQMLRNGWESIPFPGARQQTIRSPYGNAQANVVTAEQYEKLVAQGKVPDGAIIFQTRHGWDYSVSSYGNDMGIVRNGGKTTHNYASMESIIYSDCKDVVILVPKGAIQRS